MKQTVIIKVLEISRVMIVRLSFKDGNRTCLRKVIMCFFERKSNEISSRHGGLEVPYLNLVLCKINFKIKQDGGNVNKKS